MKIELPQYSGKDNLVMLAVVPSFTLLINSIIFGTDYYRDGRLFLLATFISGGGFFLDFIICGLVAQTLKNRFPNQRYILKRLTIMILIFLVITAIFLFSLFRIYELSPLFFHPFNGKSFAWCFFTMGIINVFLTFLMEGISRYENWKANWTETEKLKKAYKQSQLQGLKSQVNQHFLFNSLNSLSSLIQEDEEEAEVFLNEMTKVYRYMLRLDDEQLVTLETELKFISSYRHLLKTRYGSGLELDTSIDKDDYDKLLPPLTLQVIIENGFTQNTVSKSSPLRILISSQGENILKVSNNVQPKIITAGMDNDTALDHLVNKYCLLADFPVKIDETDAYREIYLPLIIKKEKEEEVI